MIGSIISGAIGGIVGIGTAIHKGRQAKAEAAKRQDVPLYDPNEIMMLQDIKRKSNAASTGALMGFTANNLNNMFGSSVDAATSLASGSGADVSSLLKVDRMKTNAIAQSQGVMAQAGMQYDQMFQAGMGNAVQRALDIQMLKNRESVLREQQYREAGAAGLQAGMAALSSSVGAGIDFAIDKKS